MRLNIINIFYVCIHFVCYEYMSNIFHQLQWSLTTVSKCNIFMFSDYSNLWFSRVVLSSSKPQVISDPNIITVTWNLLTLQIVAQWDTARTMLFPSIAGHYHKYHLPLHDWIWVASMIYILLLLLVQPTLQPMNKLYKFLFSAMNWSNCHASYWFQFTEHKTKTYFGFIKFVECFSIRKIERSAKKRTISSVSSLIYEWISYS